MVTDVNFAFRHPAVDIIFYILHCASEDVNAESRDDKAGEIKGLGVSGEGCVEQGAGTHHRPVQHYDQSCRLQD